MNIEQKHAWENEAFKDLKLTEVDLTGKTFEECEFTGCFFLGGSFRDVTFNECVFRDCNLSNIPLMQANMGEVLFEECKLVGLDFSSCKKLLFSIKPDHCILQMCNFSNLKMNDLSFKGSQFMDCDFYETNLSDTDFSNCNLKGSLFEQCDLSGADFRQATNYTISPDQNKLKKAKFSMPEVLSFLAPLEIEIE